MGVPEFDLPEDVWQAQEMPDTKTQHLAVRGQHKRRRPPVPSEEDGMQRLRDRMREMLEKNAARDRGADPHVGAISRFIWPWRESRLLFLVGCMAALDFTSTFVAIEISGSDFIGEGGRLANWALETAGFAGLLLMDIVAASAMFAVAIAARNLYQRRGYSGFARIAFVVALLPYAVVTAAAVFNNIMLAFL